MKLSPALLLLALALSACAGAGPAELNRGSGSTDTISVSTVQNLSGVSVRVPEMYVNDMLGTSDPLDVEMLDLTLVTEAALVAGLRDGQWPVQGAGAKYLLQAAITEYEARDLRRTGRYRMGLLLILVSEETQREVARADVSRDFQLFATPPGEQGALGDQRFVRRKLEGFTEALARDALRELGLG